MLGQEIPEDELFLLIIHFKASIERNRPKHVKILLVCSLGYGTATLLAQNIRDTYEAGNYGNTSLLCFKRINKGV